MKQQQRPERHEEQKELRDVANQVTDRDVRRSADDGTDDIREGIKSVEEDERGGHEEYDDQQTEQERLRPLLTFEFRRQIIGTIE